MVYRISKLARELAKDLEVPSSFVWDALEELGFIDAKDLDEAELKEWRIKVAAKIGWYK